MAANITQSGRAQQRVNHRVQQHIGIRMTQQTHRVGNLNAADDELSPGHQGMGVPAFTDSKLRKLRGLSRACKGHEMRFRLIPKKIR